MHHQKVCNICPYRDSCREICGDVASLLPSMERGRIDPEDLPRLWQGMMLTRAILDHEDLLTEKQQAVVRLYYREQQKQKQIAKELGTTQQAVNDILNRARLKIGAFLKDTKGRKSKLTAVPPP